MTNSNRVLNNNIIKWFALFIVLLSFIFSLTIYLRESPVWSKIDFIDVLFWQLTIWCPWILFFYLIYKFVFASIKPNQFTYSLLGLLIVGLHFGWFFLISSNNSPYLGMPATGYGVYPYFFIFWTLIDLIIAGLIFYIVSKNPSLETSHSHSKHIELTRGGETYFCEPKDIYWFTSDNYYTNLHTINGKYIMRNTLKYYHEELGSDMFIQIHRSTVVNINYVKGLAKSGKKLLVVLYDGTKKAVSKNSTSRVKHMLKNKLL